MSTGSARCTPQPRGVVALGHFKRWATKRQPTQRCATLRLTPSRSGKALRPRRTPHTSGRIYAVESTPPQFPDLPLFRQLATDLASLDKALVKIQESRQSTSQNVDASLLTTLIEEVQREQEAWFKQVEVMEKLVEQAATLETSKSELEELQKQYDEMRKKVSLYTGLLEEREREVVALNRQLDDAKTAAELKERKTAALKELVVSGTTTAQEEMGLPTWTPSDVSTLFVKEKDEVSGFEVATPQSTPKAVAPREMTTPLKTLEIPGLAVVSLVAALSRVTTGVWDGTMRHVPREIKALIEVTGLTAILVTAAAVGSYGFM